jgi:uncharacterized membrane protein
MGWWKRYKTANVSSTAQLLYLNTLTFGLVVLVEELA